MPEPSPAPDGYRRFPWDAFHSTPLAYEPKAIATLPAAKSLRRPPAHSAAGSRLRGPRPHAQARTSRMPPAARHSPGPSSVQALRQSAPPDLEIQTRAAATLRALRSPAPAEESRTARQFHRARKPVRSSSCRDRCRSPASFVHIRVGPPLLLRRLHRSADLDQRPLSNSRTIARGAVPGGLALDDLRPKRKRPALRGLGRMNTAAVALEKRALLVARLAEAHFVARPVHIFRFEGRSAHTGECSGALQIVFGEINVALLIATVGTAGLAGEANGIHQPSSYWLGGAARRAAHNGLRP